MADRGRPVRAGLLLSLAHHPVCSSFSQDVVRIAGLPVCAGCLATWPAFLAALPLAVLARLDGAPALALLALGATLALPQMTAYLRGRGRRSRAERTVAKVLGGAGLGTALAAVLTSGWPLGLAAAAIGLGVAVTGGLQLLRLRTVLATCDACPYKRDWEACPGMADAGPRLPQGPTPLVDP